MLRKRVAPAGLGTMRTDTPTFARPARRHGRARRRAHLLPRPAARPRRAGPDRPALLTMKTEPHHLTARRDRLHAAARDRLSAGHHRDRPGRVRPTKADGDPTLIAARRQGRPALLPAAPVADGLQRRARRSSPTAARTRRPRATSTATSSRPTSRSRRRTTRADERRRPVGRRDDVRLGRRPAHLRRPTPRSRRGASPPSATSRSPASAARRGQHRRPLPRPARRAGRERDRTQPRTGSMTATQTPPRPRPRHGALEVAVRAGDPAAGDRRLVHEARPARAGPQPGHVRGRGRRGDHDDRVADPASAAAAGGGTSPPGSRSRSRSGCG